ncbi:MAG: SpoIIE family protein phosphatase [Planctomycetota bacterium]
MSDSSAPIPTKRWVRDSPGGSGGQGSVLIADPDAARRTAYARALGELGFATHSTGSGREALDALLDSGRYDAAVLDMELRDQTALQILGGLMRRKSVIPAVITGKAAQQHEFELQQYPRKTFMQVRDPDLVALAVRQLVPSRRPEVSRLEHDLSAEERAQCREIQEMLVVQQLPDFPGWDSAALYQPCSVVGGDYLDIFNLPNGRVGLVVGDVSGHGFPGALIMVMVRTAFRLIAPHHSPRDTVIEVNKFVTADIRKRMFVSAAYAVLDPSTGDLEIVNCGQNPPILVSAARGAHFIPASGLAMGLNAGTVFERELRLQHLPIEIGDRLLLYTDGVPEAKNSAGEDLGEETLLKISGEQHKEGNSQDLVDSIAEAIVDHRGAALQSDDITIVSFRRLAFIGNADSETLLDHLE